MSAFDLMIENAVRAENLDALPHRKAFYIICARDKNALPETLTNLEYKTYKDYLVIYTGKTSSLKNRRHFNGTARNSTLRKSLGSLLNLEREYFSDGKYKFSKRDEDFLSKWMTENLIMFYSTNVQNLSALETHLIDKFNPPLNLDQNYSHINMEFRKYLSEKRK